MSERSQAHAAQARADLERAVAALRDSDAWRRNLAVMAQFHRYSFRNQLLIGLQMPDATYVRGFKSWIDAGRCVRKGETSIRIFAPRPWQREAAVDEAGTLQIEQGVSFAIVRVFDVSQMDPIPGHPPAWEPRSCTWPPALATAGMNQAVVQPEEQERRRPLPDEDGPIVLVSQLEHRRDADRA